MHIDAVIAKISSYSAGISKPVSVVEYGTDEKPSSPYVVVKQEPSSFRIITHVLPGQESLLRLYVRRDIHKAIYDQPLSDSGSNFRLYANLGDLPSDIITGNDDGTISMERLYRVADVIL